MFGRRPPKRTEARIPLPRPLTGDPIGVFMGDDREPLVKGYLISPRPGADGYFICDPDHHEDGRPFFATYRGDQIEKIEGDPMPGEIITLTEDGLKPGDEVFIHIRERNTSGRGTFVCEYLGYRCIIFRSGGATAYPKADVEPIARPVTTEQVLKMCEVAGVGMAEAKSILQGRAIRQHLAMAEDFDDLRRILGEVLDRTHAQNHHTKRALELFDGAQG